MRNRKSKPKLAASARANARAARQLVETGEASFTTIASRLPLIRAALSDPARGDHVELWRMSAEKLAAAAVAGVGAAAVAANSGRAIHAVGTGNAGDALAYAAAAMRCRSPESLAALNARHARRAANRLAAMQGEMLNAAAAMWAEALRPFHRASTANARRLAPRRRRA